MNISVLIPAYNPEDSLLTVMKDLINHGFENIVIVNDGSDEGCLPIFKKIEALPECAVIHHAVNLGKGRALKTGLNYIYLHFKDARGVITVDADGQHLPEDVFRVAETFLKDPSKLVIGSRKFGKGTPFRSLLGNIMTKYIFRFLVGKKITDTQSGLRCIPMNKVPELIRLNGERYEYEMNMLISTKTSQTDIIEEEISAVYIDNNRSSHFNPFLDSMKIYFLLLRFTFSSLFASFIDFAVFTAVFNVTSSISASIIVARLFSVNINFMVNRKLVFHNAGDYFITILKFYAAAGLIGSLSFLIINNLYSYLGINVILAKAMTETFLFFFGFVLQRDVIFGVRKEGA